MHKAILINDTSKEHHIGCDTVIANIKYLCKERDLEITQTFTRQDVKLNSPKLIEAITRCDIVIINGEGSLHDQYGRNFLIPLLKILPNKKAVLINSVWYNMGHIPEMSKLALISFRETRSQREFETNHSGITSRVVPDVIFDTEVEEIVGYGDSVYGQKASLLSTQRNYFPLDYHRKATINFGTNVRGYINWLKSLDLYITGRFHGVCLAILTGTPFLALQSNAGKIEALVQDLMGNQNLILYSLDEISLKKGYALFNTKNKMAEYTGKAKLMIRQLFDDIQDLLG